MCVYPENRGQKRDVGGLNLPGTVIIIAGSTTLHDFGSIFVLCRYRLGWDLFGHLSATEENMMDYDVLVVGGGPAGCATARDIVAEGFRVLVAEEHSAVGEPLQCSGLISSRALELSRVSNHVVLNELKGALVYAPDNRIFNLVGERIYGLAIDRVAFDQELAESYAKLSADVKRHLDEDLFVMSHYRTEEEQKNLYEKDKKTAALPGASEHQTGLALDVYVRNYAGSGFLKSEVGQFINKECWKCGFIIRYPPFKKHITGVRFEPWHIRYVGLPHAEIIYKEGLTLEEYICSLEVGSYYKFNNYYISRQDADSLLFPDILKDIVISPDNTGCYIITGKIK
jgi:hypothetical protein